MSGSATTYDVLGVPIAVTTLPDATDSIEVWAREPIGRFICARDVASLMAIIDDPVLSPLHAEAAMIVPDGMPLVFLGRLQGHAVERTCGPDLLPFVCARDNGLRHYLYGGGEGTAALLAQQLRQLNPAISIVGVETPPFHPPTAAEQADTLRRIRDSGADIVWVGLSSPKQDAWMRDNYREIGRLLIGVGAAFDYHAGRKRRAPRWMQINGLEWAYRLLNEPRRLWRRYLVLAPRFVWRVGLQALRSRGRPTSAQPLRGKGE